MKVCGRPVAKPATPERLWFGLGLEVDAAQLSPDERRRIRDLALDAVTRAFQRRPWFIRAAITE